MAPNDAPLILGFDCSGTHCAVAVTHGRKLLSERFETMAKGQSEHLMPLIEACLSDAQTDLGQLDAIGVGIGPGNFTGLRIAVSAARGLALALGIPAVGVDSFDALATNGLETQNILIAIPAPRGALYVQKRGFMQPPSAPHLLQADEPLPELPGRAEPLLVMPQGADLPDRTWPADLEWVEGPPLAQAIARIAAERHRMANLPRPAPLYLRPADAAPARDSGPVLLP